MSEKFGFKKYIQLLDPKATPAMHNRHVAWATRVTAQWIDHIQHRWGKTVTEGDYILLRSEGGISVLSAEEFTDFFPSPQILE